MHLLPIRSLLEVSSMKTILVYILIFTIFLTIPLIGNHSISVISNDHVAHNYIIIDAGHGGIDSGAVSCSGAYDDLRWAYGC